MLAGWTTKLLPLPAVAWGGRLLAWGLLAWAWQRLSWSVAPVRWAPVLSVALWVVGVELGHFAGEWVIGGVEAKCFAYVFVLLALNACLQDRWRAVWVHLGVATALHALVGGWSVLILLMVWALEGSGRPAFASMVPAMALGGAIGLIGVAPPIVMNWDSSPEVVAEANQIYVFERLPHHLAPLTKQAEEIAERAGRHWCMLMLLAGATAWVGWRRSAAGSIQLDRLRRLGRFAWGAALLMLCGLTIELVWFDDHEFASKLLRYYWFRMSDIAAPLAVALVATQAVGAGIERRRPWSVVLLVGLVALSAWHFAPEVIARARDPRPPADARVADLDAWIDVCQWVGENTPEDALFLVPQSSNSFK